MFSEAELDRTSFCTECPFLYYLSVWETPFESDWRPKVRPTYSKLAEVLSLFWVICRVWRVNKKQAVGWVFYSSFTPSLVHPTCIYGAPIVCQVPGVASTLALLTLVPSAALQSGRPAVPSTSQKRPPFPCCLITQWWQDKCSFGFQWSQPSYMLTLLHIVSTCP